MSWSTQTGASYWVVLTEEQHALAHRQVHPVGPYGSGRYKYRSDIATACSAIHSRSVGGPMTSTNVP